MTSLESDRPGESKEISECKFCNSHGSDLDHFKEHGVDRIDLARLTETENFYVIPDSLPVHPDGLHVLLVPKIHLYSFASLPESIDLEAQAQIDAMTDFFGGDVAIFEHGGVKHGGNTQSVYHAHAHIIAAEGNDVISYVKQTLDSHKLPWEPVHPNHHSVPTIRESFQGHGYFFIQHNNRAIISHDPADSFPSQMTQRTMSQLLTGEVVDWKRVPEVPRFADLSVNRVRAVLGKFNDYRNGKM